MEIFEEFKDRIPTKPNRKKLKIIEQSADTLLVDVTLADEPANGNDGTPINAEVMNLLRNNIISANTKADSAISTATEAKNKANEVANKLLDRGTTIYVNNVAQVETRFNSDPQTQISNIWDKIYPIGSVYMSFASTEPSVLFGGTWKKIESSFLFASGSFVQSYNTYTKNSDGKYKITPETKTITHSVAFDENGDPVKSGNEQIQITDKQLPHHTHEQEAHGHRVYGGGDRDSYCYGAGYGTIGLGGCINTNLPKTGYVTTNNEVDTEEEKKSKDLIEKVTPLIKETGEDEQVEIMPPHIVVNMWRRTA